MKIKELTLELANAICNKQLLKCDENEYACKTCPLYLNDDWFCGKSFANYNEKYGNKEIKLKECEQ